jgi:4-hydroxybenzoate polyprenyltransferase
MTETKALIYYLFLSVATFVMLVALGNWLGIVGIILALALPMLCEIVRSVLNSNKKKHSANNQDN